MRVTSSVSSMLLALAVSAGASAGFHPVSFAGETSTAGSAPPNGQTVHVVRNVAMKDTLTEAKIRYRLEEFLLTRGYTIASADVPALRYFGKSTPEIVTVDVFARAAAWK